ncbi:unannotated protein [freshwater metagenome]|uniref:Unannotated protein n=1 Tax=freshwater metagenome TaxID=449393 RepID=A0A6J7EEA9_9ZZZZ
MAPLHARFWRVEMDQVRARATRRRSVSEIGRDRILRWTVLLGLVFTFAVVASAGAATRLGDRTLKVPMKGSDVHQLQLRLRSVGMFDAPATAHYGSLTRAAVRRYQRTRCLKADGIARRATIAALVSRAASCRTAGRRQSAPRAGRLMRTRVATWYGPGSYGSTTACGHVLRATTIGIAHRTLPCGTKVRLTYRGRSVFTRVIDRGPYVAGVDYDVTLAVARRLRMVEIGVAKLKADR